MKPLNSDQMAIFDQIWSENKLYISFACQNFSTHFRHLTVDDLLQDSAVKLIELLSEKSNQYSSKDLSCIWKTSVYNMLKDEYRKHKRKVVLIASVAIGWTEITNHVKEDLEFESFVEVISKRLKNDAERQWFLCLIKPDDEIIGIMVADECSNIEKKHLAKRFNVSPATISRFLARLNLISLDVIGPNHQ